MENLATPEHTEDANIESTTDAGSEGQQPAGSEKNAHHDNDSHIDDEYSKAWDEIDIHNPPDELFGDMEPIEDQGNLDGTTEPAGDGDIDLTAEEDTTDDRIVIDNPVIKYKGKEIPVSNADELLALAQKGFDYETKMSKIKPHRAAIKVIESNGIDLEDIQALADAKGGKESAIKYIAKKYNIPIGNQSDSGFDYFGSDDTPKEEQTDYKPKVETNIDPVAEYYQTVSQQDPELGGKVYKVYEELDPEFKTEIYKPGIFENFVLSIKSGEFENVYPAAVKEKAINPHLTWLQAYVMAGKKLNMAPKPADNKPTKDTSIPRSETPPAGAKPKGTSYDEAWNMSIDDLEKELFG